MVKSLSAWIVLFCGLFTAQNALALKAHLDMSNDSRLINDARAKVVIDQGVPPYNFKWSKQSVAQNKDECSGLTEGLPVHVTITDASGATLTLTGVTPASNAEEDLNTAVLPIVNDLGSVLFWDPFAAIGIYDPVIYNDNGQPSLYPNGDVRKTSIPFIVVWLVLGAMFFTVRMGFINFRGIRQSILLIRGVYDNPEDDGEVTHFQALTAALSATVGLGNIAGVAVAISIGGPGATLWMIVAGLLGMASKFTECTLGVKYRLISKTGEVSGGPMYYLSRGLAKRGKGFKTLGKVLAVIFSILCIGGSFGGGNMFQANQAFAQFSLKLPMFADHAIIFGLILAILVGLVILGGIQSIAKVTDKIVPFMVGMYVITALIIIFSNFSDLDHAFFSIIDGAFGPSALKGGVIGVLIVGFQRAAFSNEAGVGSASIAHSASRTNHPVSEGIVALLEPFVDTVVVCTMTALVLIFTGYADDPSGLQGSQLTSAAFSSVFSWFDWVLMVAILLFAFSTMISWSYYGLKAWTYLFGDSKLTKNLYKFVFLIFIIIGSSVELGSVLDFSDMMVLGMAFPNILGLLILSGEVKVDLRKYMREVKTGVIKRFK